MKPTYLLIILLSSYATKTFAQTRWQIANGFVTTNNAISIPRDSTSNIRGYLYTNDNGNIPIARGLVAIEATYVTSLHAPNISASVVETGLAGILAQLIFHVQLPMF